MSTSAIDPSDPLFLHASRHPSMILVPKVLDGTNFVMWRRSMLVSLGVLYMETPSEIWIDLQERFSQGDFSHHYQTQQSIVELKQNQDSIFSYYTKMKMLWDELTTYSPTITCTCEGKKDLKEKEEKIRLGQFLMGLNDTYSAV